MNALLSKNHNPANGRPDSVSIRAAAIERSNTEALPYLETAIPIGLTGAAAVAVFVFLIDLAAGQPLATPNALGAAIFRGIAFDLATPIEAIHVLSYTLLHSALFVIAATAAIVSEFSFSEKGISLGKQFLPGTAALFVALQASILTLVALLDLPVSNRFEFGRLLAINGVAAFAMSTTTYYWARARLSMDADSARRN